MIGIVTDSSAQLPTALAERYGIEVVPLMVTVDGEQFAEGVDLDADDFYARFEKGTPTVSTSQPSPDAFADAYARVAEGGASEILSIHIGSSVSDTFKSAVPRSPGARYRCVSSTPEPRSFGVSCCVWEAALALERGRECRGGRHHRPEPRRLDRQRVRGAGAGPRSCRRASQR